MTRAVARRRAGFAHTVEVEDHTMIVDEPVEAGGADEGPSPIRILVASLASCTAITVAMYADRKGWDIDGLVVTADLDATPKTGEGTHFSIEVALPPGLDDDQRERIMVIAGKCPVHRILSSDVEFEMRMTDAEA